MLPSVAPVQLSQEALRIRGQAKIVLCASVFYFRIPRERWAERLAALRAHGYDCVDVYFPWNYHEESEGEWRFDGDRDAGAFLDAVREAGLLAVARPGPYICSEWDGGGLPAYLLAEDGIRLRDNDPRYLRHASRWYERILPILRRHQLSEGGPILCVQLENELDFYGCQDPAGYMKALREMALRHGIDVPLIACAGQGGLFEATGDAEGVVPACNFYPHDRDPEFEEKVLRYRERLAERNYPLLVTETNRSHFLLRRLLGCGVKLLGPYLQVSGTDFGFSNATNNWGEPLAFLTSDYDFGGMISPEGRIRPEACEGRLLSRLIDAYGESLAEAVPLTGAPAVGLGDGAPEAVLGPRALSLSRGGQLVFLHHAGEPSGEGTERAEAVPLRLPDGREVPLRLAAGESVALPANVPIAGWGTLLHSTAELFLRREDENGLLLAFHAEGAGELALGGCAEALAWKTEQAELANETGRIRFSFGEQRPAWIRAEAPDGARLRLVIVDRRTALEAERIGADGEIETRNREPGADLPVPTGLRWTTAAADPAAPPGGAEFRSIPRPDFLEKQGIYRGCAWYEAELGEAAAGERKGWLLRRASDVLSLYADGAYRGTFVPGGSDRYVESPETAVRRLTVRAEIWGHSNFHDARLPGLDLASAKGLKNVVSVAEVHRLGGNWRTRYVRGAQRERLAEWADAELDDRSWTIAGFGGWLSAERPALECFRRSFPAARDADSWTVHFRGLQGRVRLFVNGADAGKADPYDPYLDITPYVVPGEAALLAVFLERTTEAGAGDVVVYEGNAARKWRLAGAGERELAAEARDRSAGAAGEAAEWPCRLEPGEMRWLFAPLPASPSAEGWRVRVRGTGLKLSVLVGDRLVSRLWLEGGEERPTLRGGDASSFWIPGPWLGDGGSGERLSLLLEAVDPNAAGLLEQLDFIPA
ncbi:beta-galactosidase [Cohnella cellulosilytica]|uniref:Beta-galactosidase n=1 Tax=Cohnella cellulosilytica TaxID=986710 RepID=A0ABW2F945_9BACL